VDRLGIEARHVPESLVALEREAGRERGHRLIHPIPQEPAPEDRLPELEQIVRAGDHEQQAAVVAEDAMELGRVPARRDGRHRREGRGGIGQGAVGVRHDEVEARVPRGRRLDRGHRDVDSVALAPEARRERAQVVALAAADLEQRIRYSDRQQVADRAGELRLEATGQKAPPRRHRGGGISRSRRPAILGLQQVDVTAPGDVEGMRARARQASPLPRKRKAAAADRAEQGDQVLP
jgi:hypothetical protein